MLCNDTLQSSPTSLIVTLVYLFCEVRMNVIVKLLENYMYNAPKCLFHLVTGWYCPGCGGTRALYLFLTGHWMLSFCFHPLVLYTFFTFVYIGIRKICNHKYHPGAPLLWGALVLVLANFIIKNVCLFFHIDLLQMLL